MFERECEVYFTYTNYKRPQSGLLSRGAQQQEWFAEVAEQGRITPFPGKKRLLRVYDIALLHFICVQCCMLIDILPYLHCWVSCRRGAA